MCFTLKIKFFINGCNMFHVKRLFLGLPVDMEALIVYNFIFFMAKIGVFFKSVYSA